MFWESGIIDLRIMDFQVYLEKGKSQRDRGIFQVFRQKYRKRMRKKIGGFAGGGTEERGRGRPGED